MRGKGRAGSGIREIAERLREGGKSDRKEDEAVDGRRMIACLGRSGERV